MVDVKLLEHDSKRVRVALKGIDRSYANAIRRFTISEVPSLAIDEVVIMENSSIVYDELIAHRLGLVPLRIDLSRYVLPDKCDCKVSLGCSKCRAHFVLDTEANNKPRIVYSGDLASTDREVRPISDHIPITKLAPGQRLKLEAYAKLGRGREHAKWQPVTASVLREIEGKENEFELYLETVGALSPVEILIKAIEVLNEKITSFASQVKEMNISG